MGHPGRCLAFGFGFASYEAADAVERAGFAEDFEAFEQRGGLGAAGQDRSEEHEVFLDRPLLGGAGGADGGVDAGWFAIDEGPVGGFEGGEELGGEGEGFFEAALFGQEDFGCGDDFVAEEEVGEIAGLGEGFDAGLDERGDAREVGVGEDVLAQLGEEGLGGELAQVLAVEPA